jgi:feruloyl esterase
MKKYIALAILVSTATLAHAQERCDRRCEQLKTFQMQDVVIDSARRSARARSPPSLGPVLKNLPAFCRVVGHATPTPQSRVGFEVWLPEKNWTAATCRSATADSPGIIFHQLLGQMVERGTPRHRPTTGHTGSPVDGRWAIGQPEKVRDTPSAPCTC